MLRRLLLTLIATTTLFAATVAPAAAEDLVLRDARGDMWQSAAAGASTRAPNSRLGDVTRATFRHGASNVVVRLKYVDLARAGAYANYTVRVQTGVRVVREVTVEASPRSWRGTLRVFRPNGARVTDCAASHHIDYDANTVTVVVPMACLGKPRRIRANVNNYRADNHGVFFADNPHNERDHANAWTSWLSVP